MPGRRRHNSTNNPNGSAAGNAASIPPTSAVIPIAPPQIPQPTPCRTNDAAGFIGRIAHSAAAPANTVHPITSASPLAVRPASVNNGFANTISPVSTATGLPPSACPAQNAAATASNAIPTLSSRARNNNDDASAVSGSTGNHANQFIHTAPGASLSTGCPSRTGMKRPTDQPSDASVCCRCQLCRAVSTNNVSEGSCAGVSTSPVSIGTADADKINSSNSHVGAPRRGRCAAGRAASQGTPPPTPPPAPEAALRGGGLFQVGVAAWAAEVFMS